MGNFGGKIDCYTIDRLWEKDFDILKYFINIIGKYFINLNNLNNNRGSSKNFNNLNNPMVSYDGYIFGKKMGKYLNKCCTSIVTFF